MRYLKSDAKKPEYLKGVPEQRVRECELHDLFKLYASWDAVEKVQEDSFFVKRVKSIPNGWRDLRMLRAILEKLVNAIMWTIPAEKVEGVARTVTRMRYSVTQGKAVTRPNENNEQIVAAWEIDALVAAAHQYRCRLCDGTNCSKCKLGKALDNLVAFDREGGSWSMLDIEVGDE